MRVVLTFNNQDEEDWEQAIEKDGVYNIFAEAGKKNSEISILSEEYMEKIRKMKHKNIATEMLRKLLENHTRVFAKTRVVKSQLFSEARKVPKNDSPKNFPSEYIFCDIPTIYHDRGKQSSIL